MRLIQLKIARDSLKFLAANILDPKLGIKIHRIVKELNAEVNPFEAAINDIQSSFQTFRAEQLKNFGLPVSTKEIPKDSDCFPVIEEEIARINVAINNASQEESDFLGTYKGPILSLPEIENASFRIDNKFTFDKLSDFSFVLEDSQPSTN